MKLTFYKIRFLALLLVLISCAFNLKAQEINVSGKVTSESDPLPGVNILIEGSKVGAVTDVNGNYSIKVGENATLVFSMIGYKTERIPVEGRSSINVTLSEDIQSLEEVVVAAIPIIANVYIFRLRRR
jgi:hypothetical protein